MLPHAAGLNLVLVSRTESKLAAAAAELAGAYGVQARTCAADLTQAGPDTIAKIGAVLEGLDVSGVSLGAHSAAPAAARAKCPQPRPARTTPPPHPHLQPCLPAYLPASHPQVGILVNNAGVSYDHPEYLDQVEGGTITDIVTVNALVPTLVRPGSQPPGQPPGTEVGGAQQAWAGPCCSLPACLLCSDLLTALKRRPILPIARRLQLCSLVLKGMKERGRGVVINVGSGVSTVIPTSPLLSGGCLPGAAA